MRMMKWRRPSEALGWWIFLACLVMYGLSVTMSIVQVEPGEGWVEFIFEPLSEAMIDLGMGGSVPLQAHAYWTLITANYLHANIVHIGMNMLCLIEMMPIVVQQFGRSRTFVIYTLAGIASSLGSIALGEYYSLGASGCIFGLFGAQVAYGLRVGGVDGWLPVKNNLLWFILSLGAGFTVTDHISNGGHIGGLVGGFVVAMVLGAGSKEWRPRAMQQADAALLAVTGLCILVGTALGSWASYLAQTDRPAYETRIRAHANAQQLAQAKEQPGTASSLYARGLMSYDQRNWQAALDDLTAASKQEPRDYGILLALANTLYMMERYDESVTAFDRAINVEGRIIKPRYYRAVALEYADRHDDAIVEYTAITRLQPEETLEYAQRGDAFKALKQWDQAIADYDVAIERNPSTARPYFDRGEVRAQTGDMQGAVADFSEAIKLFPDAYGSYGNRANAYFALRQWDNAIEDYNTALTGDPDASNYHYGRAGAYFNKGDMAAAIADYSAAIEQTPPNYDALVMRGIAYAEMQQYDKGLSDLDTAITDGNANALAFNGRAWALFKIGKATQALPDVERALALEPDFAAALDTRAHIYEAMGERDKAIADYRAGLAKDPSMEGSKDGLLRLGAL